MNSRSSFILVLILTLTGLTSGCRSGCSLFGRSLSLLVIPMYKQPLGYSSTYHQHLTLSSEVIDYADDDVTDQQCRTTEPADVVSQPTIESSDGTKSSDKVIFPKPCGPVCELPADGKSAASDNVERR